MMSKSPFFYSLGVFDLWHGLGRVVRDEDELGADGGEDMAREEGDKVGLDKDDVAITEVTTVSST